MAAYTLTVGGSGVNVAPVDSFHLQQAANARASLAFEYFSTIRPTTGSEVTVTENSVVIFGGLLDKIIETSPGGEKSSTANQSHYNINCSDFTSYIDKVEGTVNESIPPGTLKAALTVLVGYLSTFGVTLDGTQVDGPNLGQVDAVNADLKSVMDQLAATTGYLYQITATKKLRMFAPGGTSAPFDVTDSAGNFGDVQVDTEQQDYYKNQVIVRFGLDGGVEVISGVHIAADGITRRFLVPAQWPPAVDDASSFVYISAYNAAGAVIFFRLAVVDIADIGPSFPYCYDSATHEIVQHTSETLIPSGGYISIEYDMLGPLQVQSDDAGEQVTYGLQTVLFDLTGISPTSLNDVYQAETLAASELSRRINRPKQVQYTTRGLGLSTGQSQTLTIASRGLSAASGLITEIDVVHDEANLALIRRVTVVIGTTLTSNWRDVYLNWTGSVSAIGSVSGGVSSGGSGIVNANDLTGTTLASGVVNSSLTSVGTLTSLTTSGAISCGASITAGHFSASTRLITLSSDALGTGANPGTYIVLGRNSSGGGAPGNIVLEDKAGIAYVLYIKGGALHCGTTQPTEASIPDGTVGLFGGVAASSLSGTTLASNVVTSSLTSVGALTSLNVAGNLTVTNSGTIICAGKISNTSGGLEIVGSGSFTGSLSIGTPAFPASIDSAGAAIFVSLVTNTGGAFGTGQRGSKFIANRNTSGGGAPGIYSLLDKDGASYYLYIKAGQLHASTAQPVEGTIGDGTVSFFGGTSGPAPAGTLTGATLASNVVASSLTSVGTLTGLTISTGGGASLLMPTGGSLISIEGGGASLSAVSVYSGMVLAGGTSSPTTYMSMSGNGGINTHYLGGNFAYNGADGNAVSTEASWRMLMRNVTTLEMGWEFRAASAGASAFTRLMTLSSTGQLTVGAINATDDMSITKGAPEIKLYDSGGSSNARKATFLVVGGNALLRALNDDNSVRYPLVDMNLSTGVVNFQGGAQSLGYNVLTTNDDGTNGDVEVGIDGGGSKTLHFNTFGFFTGES